MIVFERSGEFEMLLYKINFPFSFFEKNVISGSRPLLSVPYNKECSNALLSFPPVAGQVVTQQQARKAWQFFNCQIKAILELRTMEGNLFNTNDRMGYGEEFI